MSEHIFKTDGESVVYVNDTMGLTDVTGAREEIIRCRDCVHFREIPYNDGSVATACSGVFSFVGPSPDGFCSWAVRRDG